MVPGMSDDVPRVAAMVLTNSLMVLETVVTSNILSQINEDL